MVEFDQNWVGPPDLAPMFVRSQQDKDIWHSVVVDDEYHCPHFDASEVVIDIGAHIGSFCFRAWKNGSRSVYGYEVDKDSATIAAENLHDCEGARVFNVAIVRSDNNPHYVWYLPGSMHTDQSLDFSGEDARTCVALSLDTVLESKRSVSLLKIDCEGSEYPILYTSKKLDRINRIVGEYHDMPGTMNGRDKTGSALCSFLHAKGFGVAWNPTREGLGLFWAVRI